ncbi:MAG: hypothetical protein HRT88_18620, partial [Lentisphaeraceae bacterium]|nr:hypothetical protein [Lentisphaeraceae bacterium]
MSTQNKSPYYISTAGTLICLLCISLYWLYYRQRSDQPKISKAQANEAYVRDLMMKGRYWLQSSNDDLKISPHITVIGIDEKTVQKYGRYGNKVWDIRIPYDA